MKPKTVYAYRLSNRPTFHQGEIAGLQTDFVGSFPWTGSAVAHFIEFMENSQDAIESGDYILVCVSESVRLRPQVYRHHLTYEPGKFVPAHREPATITLSPPA